MNLYNSSFGRNSKFHWDFHKKIEDHEKWWNLCERYENFLKLKHNVKERIPRHIHQIWLGSEVPIKYEEWRRSWLKYNREYKYTLWDESSILNLKIDNEKQFIETKNLGAKSDIARYGILKKIGGIYVDTDFECIRPLDDRFLNLSFFCGQVFTDSPQLANGIMGAEPNSEFINIIINNTKEIIKTNNPNQILVEIGAKKITELFFENNLSFENVIFPSDYFYPWPNFCRFDHQSNRYDFCTEITYGIHHWETSWAKPTVIRHVAVFISQLIKILLRK